MHHAGQQRQRRTDDGTPANAQPLRLPDDQYQRQDENRTCQKGVVSENGIYGHSRFCNTDFDDKLA
ncbi:hypothetical protein RZQ90_30230, partial [Raoultella planticola]|uniref:hypothetical protein n=1 Tax=Raoultella planticola TaxID=575 RepID=UPI00292B56A5